MSESSVIQHKQTNVSYLPIIAKRNKTLARFKDPARPYTIPKIQAMICTLCNISREEMLSKRREYRVAIPRHAAIALSIMLTRVSFKDIGRRFGKRDHSTICNTRDKMLPIMDELRPFIENNTLEGAARKLMSITRQEYPQKIRRPKYVKIRPSCYRTTNCV